MISTLHLHINNALLHSFRTWIAVTLLVICGTSLKAQGAWHHDDESEFILHTGFMQSKLRYADEKIFNFGIDYTPFSEEIFSICINTDFWKNENYWMVNPIGATAVLLYFGASNIVRSDPEVLRAICYAGVESMSLNFAPCKWFEIGGYWSLLRLSKWREENVRVTGAVGMRSNFYFGPSGRFSLRFMGEYSWGYGNGDFWLEILYTLISEEPYEHIFDYSKPETPFKGWRFGVGVGVSLW